MRRSLLRLRQELTKLIETHTEKLGDASAKARAQSRLYEELLQGLNVRDHSLFVVFVLLIRVLTDSQSVSWHWWACVASSCHLF